MQSGFQRVLGMPPNVDGTHGPEGACMCMLTAAAVVYLYKPRGGAKTNAWYARVRVGSGAARWRSRLMMRIRHDDQGRDRLSATPVSDEGEEGRDHCAVRVTRCEPERGVPVDQHVEHAQCPRLDDREGHVAPTNGTRMKPSGSDAVGHGHSHEPARFEDRSEHQCDGPLSARATPTATKSSAPRWHWRQAESHAHAMEGDVPAGGRASDLAFQGAGHHSSPGCGRQLVGFGTARRRGS